MNERDWSKFPPTTEAEWLAFNSRVTRFKDEDGKERADILWEDYELLLKLAGYEARSVDPLWGIPPEPDDMGPERGDGSEGRSPSGGQ